MKGEISEVQFMYKTLYLGKLNLGKESIWKILPSGSKYGKSQYFEVFLETKQRSPIFGRGRKYGNIHTFPRPKIEIFHYIEI